MLTTVMRWYVIDVRWSEEKTWHKNYEVIFMYSMIDIVKLIKYDI